MNARFTTVIESHPWLAWLISALSFIKGVFAMMVEHADDAAKVFGVFAAIFAMIAGYYTMRIQRRAFRRGETLPPIPVEPRWRQWRRRK